MIIPKVVNQAMMKMIDDSEFKQMKMMQKQFERMKMIQKDFERMNMIPTGSEGMNMIPTGYERMKMMRKEFEQMTIMQKVLHTYVDPNFEGIETLMMIQRMFKQIMIQKVFKQIQVIQNVCKQTTIILSRIALEQTDHDLWNVRKQI